MYFGDRQGYGAGGVCKEKYKDCILFYRLGDFYEMFFDDAILVSRELSPLYAKFHGKFPKLKGTFGYRLFEVIRTFWLMSAIRVLDVYRDVPLTFKQVGTVFTNLKLSSLWSGSFLKLGITAGDWCVAGVGCLAMLVCSLLGRTEPVRDRLAKRSPHIAWAGCVALVLLMVIFGVYGIGFDATQFIYNQF